MIAFHFSTLNRTLVSLSYISQQRDMCCQYLFGKSTMKCTMKCSALNGSHGDILLCPVNIYYLHCQGKMLQIISKRCNLMKNNDKIISKPVLHL